MCLICMWLQWAYSTKISTSNGITYPFMCAMYVWVQCVVYVWVQCVVYVWVQCVVYVWVQCVMYVWVQWVYSAKITTLMAWFIHSYVWCMCGCSEHIWQRWHHLWHHKFMYVCDVCVAAVSIFCKIVIYPALYPEYDTLQHTATHCNIILQHTATHCTMCFCKDGTLPRNTSVLQCVAVCCSLLQCVAVCSSALQCVAVCCSVLQCVAVRCSALQCVAVCCSEHFLQRWYSTAKLNTYDMPHLFIWGGYE